MRERLGKVADQSLCLRVVLLRNQADVVAQSQQPLKNFLSLFVPSQQDQVIGQMGDCQGSRSISRRVPQLVK